MAEEGKTTRRTRRNISPDEKVKILQEILLKKKKVSEAAEEYGLHPTQVFAWQKELFEGAAEIFERKRPDITEKAQQRKIDALEKKIAEKDNVIAEIAQENIELKKNLTGRS